ncbi:LPS export ABC transporter periplasmic protein LptC [Natroniella sulfidigena]|uniref:LPS export ABC transporter periplasmic protein LptC n=1 Tax=Natroniella sulfidigena TaxID=723921 RepID=UPI00200B3EAF|nr:LPS export ABC transporter periplasmic protein LptC [Natroniella sulfidigena]MCK8816363.1 LPS export ABC transporter periplasmic protein LptC [Natroniella sulfidigena]
MKRTSLYLLVIIVILGFSVVVFLEDEEEKEEQVDYQYQIKESRIISYLGQERRWDLQLEEVIEPLVTDDDQLERIIAQGVKDGKFFEGEQVRYNLDVERLIYKQESKDLQLRGDVQLKESTGQQIRTEKLDWLAEEQKFRTDSPVSYLFDDGELSAGGMIVDLTAEVIDFTIGVEMTFDFEGADSDEK